MSSNLKKALLIFAKRPVPGMVKTRLVPAISPEQAADLYRCMLGDIMAKVQSNPRFDSYLFYLETNGACDYFGIYAPGITLLPQKGKDLGEKMAEAFHAVFSRGYATAIIVGSDAPDLPLHYIEAAFDRLERRECEAVFGPCEDGGYYLLGMRMLNTALFRDVPWSSNEVLAVSLERAREAGIKVSLLPVWHDVDEAADLERRELLDEGNGAPLTRAFLRNLLKR